jgi:carbonic anhydrase
MVLAVLLEAPPRTSQQQQQPDSNPCLAAGLAAVPSTHGESAPCRGSINPANLLPTGAALQQYVSYQGSLTTPPCSEGVSWLVWTTPLSIPQQQVKQFRDFAGMNARPSQPLNKRAVVSSCLGVA